MSEFSSRRMTMVDTQVRPSDVTKFPIIAAMLAVPREAYVPMAKREAAYVGENIEIAPGRVMLEARTLAKMLDALDVQPGDRVLDLACGMGYSTAVIAELASQVVGVEEISTLAAAAGEELAAQSVTNATVIAGSVASGAPDLAPFDVIVLQGGVETLPVALLAQLADGGRIGALFMQGALGIVKIGHKSQGIVTWRFAFNAAAPVLPGFAAPREFAL